MNKKLFFVLTVAVLLIATACENDGYGGYGGGGSYGGSSYSGGGVFGGGISTGGGGGILGGSGGGGGGYGGGGIFGGGITTGGGGILGGGGGGGYGGGGGGGSGTFTLTGIPSTYEGKYALCVLVSYDDYYDDDIIVGYQNLSTGVPSLCRISGGKVSIPLWIIDIYSASFNPTNPSSYFKAFSGGGTYIVGVAIYDSAQLLGSAGYMPSSSGNVTAAGFQVRFSGGKGSSSWSNMLAGYTVGF
jgi:hypothetical protein